MIVMRKYKSDVEFLISSQITVVQVSDWELFNSKQDNYNEIERSLFI